MVSRVEAKRFANVWSALEDTTAASMTMRSDVLIVLQQRIVTWKLAQSEAARRLQITQPRLNDLLRGRIAKFSLDALVDLAERADIQVRLRIDKAA
jgi:predicted XRE-type DNA-binding protein